MKNRTREICTSGTVRDEGGNILIYSANDRGGRGNVGIIRSPVRASILPDCAAFPAASCADSSQTACQCAGRAATRGLTDPLQKPQCMVYTLLYGLA
jgi:hypothetical protein